MYLDKYYWDVLTDKYNIATQSGFSKFERAIETWFRKQHGVVLSNLEIKWVREELDEVMIEIEVPVNKLGLPNDLTYDEFVDIVEGPDSEKYDDLGYSFVKDLFDTKRFPPTWDMMLDPEDSSQVVFTYWI